MSLRDQLLKAGIASRKQVQAAERELKEARRKQQAQRLSRREEEERRQAEVVAEREALLEERRRQRAERRDGEEAAARRSRANQIVHAHALRFARGVVPFWHRTPGGPLLHRLDLSRKLAVELRAGRLAVVWAEVSGETEYHVVMRAVAERLRGVLAERVLFLNDEPPDQEDPAEQLHEPREG
ncbi:MAG: DUF2058 family protein [Pseudomonadota bacterium]